MGGVSIILRPLLPPHALLHYKDFDLVCSLLGGVCEHVERASGAPAFYLAYTAPQVIHLYFKGVEFGGPYAGAWRAFADNSLTPAFEKWPKRGPCPGLREYCEASPAVFLMDAERAYRYLAKCPSITSRARELGISFARYGVFKRAIPYVVERPLEVIARIAAGMPSLEDLANCGFHGLASFKYWAATGGLKIIEELLDKNFEKRPTPEFFENYVK